MTADSSSAGSVIVTLADQAYLDHAKQVFSGVYWNAGWRGDYLLLTNGIAPDERAWFEERGIVVWDKPLWYTPDEWKNICPKALSPIVTLKLYLFTEACKRWRSVVYLDADVIVRRSLDRLANTERFSAARSGARRLDEQFIDRSSLQHDYDPAAPAFNAGVFAFPTALITAETEPLLRALCARYLPATRYSEQTVLNLLFYQQWSSLPKIYNQYVDSAAAREPIRARFSVILHFRDSQRLVDSGSVWQQEWKRNRNRAEEIHGEKQPARIQTPWWFHWLGIGLSARPWQTVRRFVTRHRS